jgi:hypothetical protein
MVIVCCMKGWHDLAGLSDAACAAVALAPLHRHIRGGATAMLNYATFELFPCVYTDRKAWVMFDAGDGWKEVPHAEAMQTVKPMTDAQFAERFPHLSIPKAALQDAG